MAAVSGTSAPAVETEGVKAVESTSPSAPSERRASRLRALLRPRTDERVPTWEEVAREHGRFIYTVAFRLTGEHDDAQDLTQEVLLRVRRGLANYQPGTIEGWLSRITTNAFLDQVRRAKRRQESTLPDEPDLVLPSAPSAEADFDRLGLGADVQKALLALPAEYRAAVVLSDIVGLSYQEVADALDVPVGTVRSRIHRARSRLRTRLA
ncbi:MAG: sigma-70 family RNA polymerase sigma factor [Actinomycetota bacterium]|nr:sigma-70 family RNA polymerase sigma factor [Actinomycetota bacterium]